MRKPGAEISAKRLERIVVIAWIALAGSTAARLVAAIAVALAHR